MNRYITKSFASKFLGIAALLSIPGFAFADIITVCGRAVPGIGAVITLCTGVQPGPLANGYYYGTGCTSNAPVGQQTSVTRVAQTQPIYACLAGSLFCGTAPDKPGDKLPFMVPANQAGIYDIWGDLISGLKIQYADPPAQCKDQASRK